MLIKVLLRVIFAKAGTTISSALPGP